jgi:hypothetical protein
VIEASSLSVATGLLDTNGKFGDSEVSHPNAPLLINFTKAVAGARSRL